MFCVLYVVFRVSCLHLRVVFCVSCFVFRVSLFANFVFLFCDFLRAVDLSCSVTAPSRVGRASS